MGELTDTLKALDEAKRQKDYLKRRRRSLMRQYELVKSEIAFHEKRARILREQNELSAFLDTVKLATAELPIR